MTAPPTKLHSFLNSHFFYILLLFSKLWQLSTSHFSQMFFWQQSTFHTLTQRSGTKVFIWNKVCRDRGLSPVVGLAERSQVLLKTNKWIDVALRKELQKCERLNLSFSNTPGSAMEERFHYIPHSNRSL